MSGPRMTAGNTKKLGKDDDMRYKAIGCVAEAEKKTSPGCTLKVRTRLSLGMLGSC